MGSTEESAWLLRGSAEEIRARLRDGDPLGLVPRCTALVRERAVLVDVERVVEGAVGLVADAGPEPDAGDLIEISLTEALDRCLDEDRELVQSGRPLCPSEEGRYAFLVAMFGLTRDQAPASAVAFNRLPDVVRRAFFAVCVEEWEIGECVEAGMGPLEVLRGRVSMALGAALGEQ